MDRINGKLALVPIRKAPDHRSEMVSQLLFGEEAVILELNKGWLQIETLFDNYTGWIEEEVVNSVSEGIKLSDKKKIISELFLPVNIENHLIYLPAGSEVPVEPGDMEFNYGNHTYRLSKPFNPSNTSIAEVALRFINSPYLWGGRTVFGIDCSGFTQLVYKVNKRTIPRDANLQANSGKPVPIPEEAQVEDLFFFGTDEDHITHVGIYLGDKRIIHASKSVRIDTVDGRGIFNHELNKYTHTLQKIRRIAD
jgi:hypothetical protein